eukprot:m.354040 g.354040  ORF g.354040 m.354040 type:complete len:154 (+) comp55931_c2_seq19:472-933(+)
MRTKKTRASPRPSQRNSSHFDCSVHLGSSQPQRPFPLKPTWSAETVIKAAKLLNILLFAKKPDLADIQSVLISIIGFVFALRAGSLASLRLKDLQLAGNNIVLALHTCYRRVEARRDRQLRSHRRCAEFVNCSDSQSPKETNRTRCGEELQVR